MYSIQSTVVLEQNMLAKKTNTVQLCNILLYDYMIIWLYDIWTPQLHFLYIPLPVLNMHKICSSTQLCPLKCQPVGLKRVSCWLLRDVFHSCVLCNRDVWSLCSRRNSAIVLSHCRVWWWLSPIILYAVAISIIKWTVLWLSPHAVFVYLFYPGAMWAELGYMGGAKNSAAHHWLIQSSHHCPDYLWNCFSTGANKFQ